MSAVQIYKLENGKYRVDLPAINEILNKAKNHLVAIYSLSRPLRIGKSFMFGFFLRYLEINGEIGLPITCNQHLPFEEKAKDLPREYGCGQNLS